MEQLHKLNIKNLLFLHEQIENALKEKDANDILNCNNHIVDANKKV